MGHSCRANVNNYSEFWKNVRETNKKKERWTLILIPPSARRHQQASSNKETKYTNSITASRHRLNKWFYLYIFTSCCSRWVGNKRTIPLETWCQCFMCQLTDWTLISFYSTQETSAFHRKSIINVVYNTTFMARWEFFWAENETQGAACHRTDNRLPTKPPRELCE